MIETPMVLHSSPQLIAFIPLIVPQSQIRQVMDTGVGEVFAAAASQGIALAGPWFTWHTRPPKDSFDFRICLPVATPIAPMGRVQAGELPAATVARTVYPGDYSGLGGAWGELHAWIAAQGHSPRPDLWECYTAGPESSPDPACWRTELNQPLLHAK